MAISSKKLLGSKGGPLAVRPKINLVPFKSKGSSIIKVGEEDPMLVIKTKVIKIEDILKGTLAAEKKAADDKRKAEEQQEREEAENEVEGDPKTGVKFKLPLPGKIKSWWGNIKKFFFTVLFGWLFLKFMKWLPKLKGILSLAVKFFEFFVWLGGNVLNAIVTAVHWGYKAFEWTRDVIGNVFGEGGLKAFDRLTSILKTVLNLQLTLTLAMIAFSNEFGENLWDMGDKFLRQILKHGLSRAPKRLLIKLLGKKGAQTVMTQGGRMLTQATAFGKSVAGVVTKTGKMIFSAPGAIVAGAGLLASAIGEGGGQLVEKGKKWNEGLKNNYAKHKDKKWWDPRKWGSWVLWKTGELQNRIMGPLISVFDIIGTPFRYLIEAIRYPFLDEQGQAKQRKNLAKFDGRIREQFRRFVNMFDFMGVVGDETGSWGNIFGHESAQKDLVRKLDDNPYKKISTYTEEDADQSETIIINNQSSSSSSSEDKSTSGDTVLAMQGAFTDTTDGKEFVGGNSAYDILHKGA